MNIIPYSDETRTESIGLVAASVVTMEFHRRKSVLTEEVDMSGGCLCRVDSRSGNPRLGVIKSAAACMIIAARRGVPAIIMK